MSEKSHVDWVDTAKGLSILFVVMLYATYSVGEDTGGIGAFHWIAGYVTPFRMPDFFAISGLFLARTLQKDTLTFLDRRVVHYAYFYLVWMVIHIIVKVGIATADPAAMLEQMAWAIVEPYGVLWFIYVLALVNLAVKLFQMLRIPHWAALGIGAALQIASFHTGIYAFDQFAAYFVYFYAGYALAPVFFRLVEMAMDHPRLALGALAVWAGVNYAAVFWPSHKLHPDSIEMGFASLPGMRLAFALIGISAIFVISGFLTRLKVMSWLTWIGKHSIVLYVSFALPMTMMRLVLIRFGLIEDTTLLTAAVYATALIAPFVLYWLVNRTGIGKFLFNRPAWFHIDTPRGRRTQVSPAE